MALLTMAIWDTEDNQRAWCTKKTLDSLGETVDFSVHRLVVVDNDSRRATRGLCSQYDFIHDVICLPRNIGQARAINRAWVKHRMPGEVCVKLDNDVVIKQAGWVEEMMHVLRIAPSVGIVALKRKSAWEHPDNPDEAWRSTLEMLPHEGDERWTVIEVCKSIVGTCEAFSPAFLSKIGYLYQVGSLWGFIDPILSASAHTLGYKTVFLPHIEIEHLEDSRLYQGSDDYRAWKDAVAKEFFPLFEQEKERIMRTKQVYHGPEDK